jgi:hypothetical protein
MIAIIILWEWLHNVILEKALPKKIVSMTCTSLSADKLKCKVAIPLSPSVILMSPLTRLIVTPKNP